MSTIVPEFMTIDADTYDSTDHVAYVKSTRGYWYHSNEANAASDLLSAMKETLPTKTHLSETQNATVYVVRFDTGRVKIGTSRSPQQRCVNHVNEAVRFNTYVTDCWVSPPFYMVQDRMFEQIIKDRAVMLGGTVVHGTEYFDGLDITSVVRDAIWFLPRASTPLDIFVHNMVSDMSLNALKRCVTGNPNIVQDPCTPAEYRLCTGPVLFHENSALTQKEALIVSALHTGSEHIILRDDVTNSHAPISKNENRVVKCLYDLAEYEGRSFISDIVDTSSWYPVIDTDHQHRDDCESGPEESCEEELRTCNVRIVLTAKAWNKVRDWTWRPSPVSYRSWDEIAHLYSEYADNEDEEITSD